MAGQYFDAESGLHYNYHRYYGPKIGRYITPDPIGMAAGINLYSYTSNNPINSIDPLGLYESPWYLQWVVPGQHMWDRSMTAFESGQYGWGTAYLAGMLGEQALFALSLGQWSSAQKATQCSIEFAIPKSGKTVLGKFPDYLKLADEIGAKRFNVPTKVWNKMTKAEQWAANKKFLDRMIKRGDEVILSNPVNNINKVSGAFRQELNYLVEKGFRLSKDGTKMIK